MSDNTQDSARLPVGSPQNLFSVSRQLTRSAIIIVSIFITSQVHAQELVLRCDAIQPQYGPKTEVVTIDPVKNMIHVGESDDSGFYVDGRKLRYVDPDTVTPGSDEVTKKCTYLISQYVTITKNKIEFGDESTSIEPCGTISLHSSSDLFKIQKESVHYIINKTTGIASIRGNDYQCQVIEGGKTIP